MAGDTKLQYEVVSMDEKRSDDRMNMGFKQRLARNWAYFRYY